MAVTPKESGHPSTLETRVAELERFCGQLALENAALKKPCRVIKSYKPSGRETASGDSDGAASVSTGLDSPALHLAGHQPQLVLCHPPVDEQSEPDVALRAAIK